MTPRQRVLVSFVLWLLAAGALLAHQPADTYSARADLRVDDQRGLRLRVWLEVPDAAADEVDSVRARLARCLPVRLDGAQLAGEWRRGDDPKDGLSNGSHTLFALEFEPAAAITARRFEVELRVECFADRELAVTANARAREPWQVVAEDLPEAGHPHHDPGHGADEEAASRRLRVVFARP